MNIFDFYQKKIIETIKKNKKILKISEVNFNGMQVELAPEKFNCDISTNIAMLLTKRYKKNLKKFSEDLRNILIDQIKDFQNIEIAGSGFLNISLKENFLLKIIDKILKDKDNYGSQKQNKKINIEFVSANPTGPMHVGHCRGAVLGDVISNLLSFNGMYKTEAPYVRNAYVSPRTRDQLVPNLKSTEIISGDLNYNVRLPFLKARLTGFYTQINNQTWARSFYHDEYRTFVNYMMTNVDQLFMGIELGFESNITSTVQFSGAFTMGDYLYQSRPVATITRDNSQEIIALDKVVYLKNFKIGGMPQQATSVGLKYNAPKYWYAGINFNYFADIYLSPNPDRRTSEAISGYADGFPYINEIIDQTITTFFKSPKSYTGEDMVEISCHGSISVINKITKTLLIFMKELL